MGRFESLIPVGVHSKLGKVTKPKSFKITGAGQPFVFREFCEQCREVSIEGGYVVEEIIFDVDVSVSDSTTQLDGPCNIECRIKD